MYMREYVYMCAHYVCIDAYVSYLHTTEQMHHIPCAYIYLCMYLCARRVYTCVCIVVTLLSVTVSFLHVMHTYVYSPYIRTSNYTHVCMYTHTNVHMCTSLCVYMYVLYLPLTESSTSNLFTSYM